MATPRCYCYVERLGAIVPCAELPHEGTDFCKNHLMIFNLKTRNVIVSEKNVSYVNPRTGQTIMDDTWFRRNERFFRGHDSKLVAGSSSYTWIFVYYMIKRIEQKLKRFEHYTQASLIQRTWRRCISDPNYMMCRKRLAGEFNSMPTSVE